MEVVMKSWHLFLSFQPETTFTIALKRTEQF